MTEHNIHYVKLHQCTFEQALYVRNRGFEEYFSDMTTTMPNLLKSFAGNSISPEHSVVAFDHDQPIGFVFVAMKEVEGHLYAWNGGTGIIPEYRGKGLAKPLMNEMKKVMEEQQVHSAYLEVVTKNTPAFSAYKSIGFEPKDEVIGLSKEDELPSGIFDNGAAEGTDQFKVEAISLSQVSALPFYKEEAAWDCQWHVMDHKGGKALVVRDADNEVLGYAMYQARKERTGQLASASLFQLEVAPHCSEAETVVRLLMKAVFLPEQGAAKRQASNFSSTHPYPLQLLEKAGFKEIYKQYVMKWSGQPA